MRGNRSKKSQEINGMDKKIIEKIPKTRRPSPEEVTSISAGIDDERILHISDRHIMIHLSIDLSTVDRVVLQPPL